MLNGLMKRLVRTERQYGDDASQSEHENVNDDHVNLLKKGADMRSRVVTARTLMQIREHSVECALRYMPAFRDRLYR